MNKKFESLSPSAKWIIIKGGLELTRRANSLIKNGWLLPSGEFCACEFSEHQSYLAVLNYSYVFSLEESPIKFNYYDNENQYSVDFDAYSIITDEQLEFFMANIDFIDNLVMDALLERLKTIDPEKHEDYSFILSYR